MSTSARMFLAIGGFLLIAAGAYWVFDYEEAGTVLLLLSAGLALVTGGYLITVTRGADGVAAPGDDPDGVAGEGQEAGEEEPYLPHASIWPMGVGVGSVVLANGLALGLWAVVPGVIILGACTFGYARQSRRRD